MLVKVVNKQNCKIIIAAVHTFLGSCECSEAEYAAVQVIVQCPALSSVERICI